ncbi:Protein CBG00479 [Caenorhabditis briggsae]|uniref:Protein CBG00479 n=1 Tax=Caenorhabditis briggsae TaxID=6238 RepID=A8WMR5_CAEBR|nr:Protein CBG00479 [Caenorhabditis briggsae]CAP21770.1 Protein CBG00479 [Caenorhabditis briggsae]
MHLSETAVDFRDPTPPGIKFSEELTDNPPNLHGFVEAYINADNEKFFTENDPSSEAILQKVINLGVDFLGREWKNTDKSQVNVKKILNLGGGDFNLFPTHVTWTDHPDSISLENLQKEINLMESWTNEIFEDTVVFCHNDLAVERGLGPKLYGFFEGGRLEEYLPSEGFTEDDYWKPEELEGGDYEILPTTVTYSDHPKTISVQKLSEEIDTFEKWAREVFEHTLVFGQIDFGVSNVLELNSTKEMVLIDCEFSSYNWRGFDLAMFVSESAITFNVPFPPGIKISEDLTDNSPNIRILCEAYLDADNTLKNHIPSDRSSELESLIQECLFFWPLTHLFWALSAMKHALLKFENGVDLDVQARDRLAVYFHLKPRSQKIYEKLKKWKKAL